jgi:hypothetical protein
MHDDHMFKRILKVLGILLVLVIVIPFIGPWLGLADYRSMAPEPGQRVNLPNGDHVNVYREGSGKPVVLIHGRPGSGRMMLPLARALERLGYSAITYDRIGYGHSSRRSSEVPANPTENARDLLQLIETLGLVDPLIVAVLLRWWCCARGCSAGSERIQQTHVDCEPRRQLGAKSAPYGCWSSTTLRANDALDDGHRVYCDANG